jgi:large subunit ribosomal protein L13
MLKRMTTYSLKGGEIDKGWQVIDADGQTLGRLATEVAGLLRGKHKPSFTPHMDMGDNVIVLNASKVKVTGNKLADKTYYHHTGYMGGLKERQLEEMLAKHPERVIEMAVRGMLPKTKLGHKQLKHLKVYAGAEHLHEAQVNADRKRRNAAAAATGAKTEKK